MTPYRVQHDSLFRTVADILVRDYIAPSKTADTVAEWCENDDEGEDLILQEPSDIAQSIADVEGYEKR